MAELYSTDDDARLRQIQQDLVRAWREKDRAVVERILAPEWSVTQADGSILTRATVVGSFFDSVSFDSNTVDDIGVMLYGDAAVVRGRTACSGRFNGERFDVRIRFTDVFIKRDGRWQAVASHASPLSGS
jgi:ketosteroid isomerase-like protein